MNLVPIGEICALRNGRAFKPTEWSTSGTPIIRIQNLTDQSKPFNYCNFEVDRKFHVENGDLLFSWSGTPGTSFGAFFWRRERGYLNQHIFRIDPYNPKDLYLEYFRLALNSKLEEIIGQAHGGVGLQHITKEKLNKVKVYLPEYNDQIRIAHLLCKVEGLIAQRKQQLQQLDDLLKSVFYKMFGDPVRNEKGWEKKPFSELLVDIESGTSPKCEARAAHENEWGVLKLGAVTSCFFKPEENKALPTDVKPTARDEVRSGDLLFTRKNTYELVAACAYVFNTRSKLLMPDLVFRFIFKKEISVNPIFYWKLLIASSQRKKIQSLAAGAAGSMPNISKGNLKQTMLVVPPFNLQNKFAEIVEKVEVIKIGYQQSLTDLESLYGALSQQAFKGQLDLSRIEVKNEYTSIEKVETKTKHPYQPEETFNFPIPIVMRAISSSVESKKHYIEKWLKSYLKELGDEPISANDFMERVKEWLQQESTDDLVEWGLTEYDYAKDLVFSAINTGEIKQLYNSIKNRVEVTSSKG